METTANSASGGASAATGRHSELAWLPASGCALDERPEVAVAREASRSLYEALARQAEPGRGGSIARRIHVHLSQLSPEPAVPPTDRPGRRMAWIVAHCVRLARLARRLARPRPTLVFQPLDGWETARALAWACARGMRAAARGAGPSVAGAPSPVAGGLWLDMSLVRAIGVDARQRVAVAGAGVRVEQLRQRLAESGLALLAEPEDPGASLVASLASGRPGRNAFAHGGVTEQIRWAEVALPQGLHLRLFQDGGLEVLDDPLAPVEHLAPPEAADWFARFGLPHLRPADIGDRGRAGVLVSALLDVGPAHPPRPHLVPFARRHAALQFARTLAEEAERTGRLPLNLEYRAAPDSPGGCVYVDFADAGAEELLRAAAFLGPLAGERSEAAAQALAEKLRPAAGGSVAPRRVLVETGLDLDGLEPFMEAAERICGRLRTPLEFEVTYLRRGRARVRACCPARPGLRDRLISHVLQSLLGRGPLARPTGMPQR
jgi:hypothetical protein